jgi:alginate O-acetyltransferase complex protein AlgJ
VTAGGRYQSFLTALLRQGNDKVIVGREGFLFFRKEVDMASGPGFLSRRSHARRGAGEDVSGKAASDPVAAIVDYDRQLRARGIHLLFVPLPLKPFLYPEHLWPGYPAEAGPAWNSDRDRFHTGLVRAGVDVLDVTDDLWRAKGQGEVFLRRDTHWTPLGLGVAADRIAERLRPLLGPTRNIEERRTVTVTNGGDLLRLLESGPGTSAFPPQTVEIVEGPPRGGDGAAVLLLGDSFTNVYSRKELEWGEHAGLGEQLMLRLGLPVQVLALNGGGATAVRELLAQKPAALASTKVVVWACSARDLYDEAIVWEKVPLPGEGR